MVKILRDFALTESVESVSRQRIISTSEASGESSEENQQAAAELPPLNDKVFSGIVPSASPKTARLLFANKKARDIMYDKELEHLRNATADR